MNRTRNSGYVLSLLGGAAIVLGGLGGLGALEGCAKSDKPAEAATQTTAASSDTFTEEDEATEGIRDAHRHHHGGVAQLLSISAQSLGVSPDKAQQITKIQSDLKVKMAPERDAERALLSTLADGVAASTIDKSKIDATVAQMTAAAGAAHDASLDALNQLHAVLSPVERQTLVDKVEANWKIWRHVNIDEQPGSHMIGDQLTHLADEVDLTPDQVITISVSLHDQPQDPNAQIDPQNGEDYVKAFRSSFGGDSFDAKSLNLGSETSMRMAKVSGARMIRFYSAATPVMNPEQRTKVADHLREHADDTK